MNENTFRQKDTTLEFTVGSEVDVTLNILFSVTQCSQILSQCDQIPSSLTTLGFRQFHPYTVSKYPPNFAQIPSSLTTLVFDSFTVRRHFVPRTNCPNGVFRETNCPIRQNVPLSPQRQIVPSDKLSHFLPGDKMSH